MKESDDEIKQARLFEELTLERVNSPPYGVFDAWHQHGHIWFVRNVADYVYLNSDGKMHRIHGPAYVSKKFKTEKWFKEDKLHRIGGPALSHKSTLLWYKEGVLHNLEGPAVVDPVGPLQYWIDGVRYKRKQYEWEIKRRKRKGLLK